MPITYHAIASATVTNSPADIQFTNIPQTYTDLYVQASVAGRLTSGTTGALVIYTAIGQSQSLSTWKNLYGNGSGAGSNSAAYPIVGSLEYQTGTIFSSVGIYIPNYTSSTRKFFSSESVTEANATAVYTSLNSLLIDTTSAISLLGFGDGSAGGGLKVGSSITLYGIKKD